VYLRSFFKKKKKKFVDLMGRLLEGKWITQDLGSDAQGRYVRRATQFRETAVPVEKGRYLLIVGYACGWSHRTLLVRALMGLQENDIIPLIVCEPFMGDDGWTLDGSGEVFFPNDPSKKDIHVTKLYELYILAKSDYTGRASVPVLWDTQRGTIISNESSEINKIFINSFAPLAKTPQPDLLPSNQEQTIQAMIQANYGPVNNGVYKCGFASNQEAYQEAVIALFDRLDQLEALLEHQRFLMGNDYISLADVCLFPTLYRFDQVYHTHFKCNMKHVYEYPNLWGWLKEMYQIPGVKETCHMDHIKEHYYTSHESIHPRRYVPVGPKLDFDSAHGRDTKEYGNLGTNTVVTVVL
jgi:glutathionyl-hydroquinone reductase